MKVWVAQLQYHGEKGRDIKENCISIYLCLDQIQDTSSILHYLAGKPYAIHT